MVRAVILLSGGLDSSVLLAMALKQGRECYTISFDYGQRHLVELEYAQKITQHYNVSMRVIHIDSSLFRTSSLVSEIDLPQNRTKEEISAGKIPNTYVPARNTLFFILCHGIC